MTTLTKLLSRFKSDEDGATLVEYGIALGLAVTLGAGALLTLSGDVGATMGAASEAMPVQAAAGS
ncbi:Flp family type IVb pilin [Thalassococcus profundi]|uniref:Flp family type IVb pilin n=1 Tax=Thalassococcus profundi TaxID=2282382 RepID=A0A369TT20_9RHOB|nr:Flp family type IVb pilin [Thalassococcus profundi]RDD67874.1 Flp family type IVb pilin [Thalassococcus profundi]